MESELYLRPIILAEKMKAGLERATTRSKTRQKAIAGEI